MAYGAQHIGPLASPQLNNDIFVGSDLYATIQAAVTAAAALSGGGRVVIPFGVSPSDTIAAASGNTSVLIEDRRNGYAALYAWANSTYTLQLATTPNGTKTGTQIVNATDLSSALSSAGSLPTASAAGQFLKSQGANNTYAPSVILASDLPNTAAAFTQIATNGGTAAGTVNFTATVPIQISGSGLTGQATITSSATPVLDGTNGTLIVYSLAQNVTSSTFANLIKGVLYQLEIVQAASGTGPFTFVYPTNTVGSAQWTPVSQNPGARTVHLL